MPKNKKIKGLTVEIGGDTTKLGQSLDRSKSISTGLQKELREVNRLLKGDPNDTELLAQKQKLLSDRVGETKTQLDLLKDKQGEVNKLFENGEIGEEDYRAYQREVKNTQQTLDRLQAELDKTSEHFGKVQRASEEMSFKAAESNVDSLKGKFRDFAEQSEKNLKRVSDKLGKVGSGMQTAGSKLTPVSAGAAGVLGAGVKLASDFEDEFAFLTTLAKEDGITYDELKKQIIQLSNDTGIDAATLARNTYDTISAGQETKDAVDYLRQAVGLSKAGKADVSNALDILTTITNAYEMESKQAGYINDILIQTQNLGKTTVGDLSQYMGKVIPTAKSFNVQLNQLGTAYAIMTSKGIATADSTTYINSLLSELGKSGTAVSKIIKDKTGKSFSELMENGATLGDVLAIIDEKAKENNKSFADLFKKTNSAKAATALYSGDASKFNGVLKEMDSSSGAATKALSKLDTNSAKVKKTVNELKNVGIELGSEVLEQAKPLLTDALNGVKGLTEWIKKLNPEQKQALVKAIEIFAVLGPGLTTVGKMTSGISNLAGGAAQLIGKLISMTAATEAATVAQEGLNVAQDSNPVGLVIAAVAGLTAAIGLLIAVENDETVQANLLMGKYADLHLKIKENVEAYDEMKEASKKAVDEAAAQFGHYDELKERLDEIVDAKGRIKKGHEDEADAIINTLSGALDIEIKKNGNVITDYQNIQKELKKVIELKKAEAIQSAYADQYNSAVKSQRESFSDFQEARDALNELDAELRNAKEIYRRMEPSGHYATNARGEKIWREDNLAAAERKQQFIHIQQLQATRKQLEEDLNKQQQIYLSHINTISNYENLTAAIANGNVKEIEAATSRMEMNFVTAQNGTKAMLEQQVKDAEKNYNDLKSAVDAGAPGVTQRMVDNAAEMVRLSKAELDKLPPHTDATFKSTSDAVISKGSGLKGAFKETAKGAVDSAAKEFNKLPDLVESRWKEAENKARKQGKNFSDGYASGMTDFTGVRKNAGNLASEALNALIKRQNSHSPSKESEKLGGDFGEGYSLGIAEKAKKAGRNSAELAQAALEALNAANGFGFSDAPQPQLLTGRAGVQPQVQLQQIDAIMGKIDILTKAVQSLGYIRLNDDTLVGATADKYDSAIGQIALRKERGW